MTRDSVYDTHSRVSFSTVKVRASPRCSCRGRKGRTQVKGGRGVHLDGIRGQPGCSHPSCEARGPGCGVSLRGGWEAPGHQQRHTDPAGHPQAALLIHAGSSDRTLGSPLGPGMPPHLRVEGPSPRPCVVTVSLPRFAPLNYRSIISVHNTAGSHKEGDLRHLGTRAGVFFLFQVCCV